jgi:hypothetical protein
VVVVQGANEIGRSSMIEALDLLLNFRSVEQEVSSSDRRCGAGLTAKSPPASIHLP